MKLLISSLNLIVIVVFTGCSQEPVSETVSEEKGTDAADEMIEVEIFDRILFQRHRDLELTKLRILGKSDSEELTKEQSTARMIIRVGDYDWELTEGNHYKALKDGEDYFDIEGNPLKHSWGGGSITTFNLEGSRAVKRYLGSKKK